MMAAPPVSIEKYQDRVQQIQAVMQTDTDPEASFTDTSTSCSPDTSELQTQMDLHKTRIYTHPLFPLLALLFEKCEQTTQSSECVTSASLEVDIENFVRNQEKDGKAFFTEDPEVDSLMVKAIQVLRIHLLELEKVSELCKDFCNRYISCLKTKMNSDNLLSGELGCHCSSEHTHTYSSFSESVSPQGVVVNASALQPGNLTIATVTSPQAIAGSTVYQPVTVVTPEGHVVTQAISPSSIHIQNPQQLQLQLSQDFFSAEDSSKNKRGILPKHATSVMRSWLFQHLVHPYPSEAEKRQLANQTNLTLLQVNNWFINARRRILQPMLDSSTAETPKTKKKTPQNRPTQRFWPDSIAGSMSQQNMTDVNMSVDGFQTLSSDGATLAMQQVMIGKHSDDDGDDTEDEEDTSVLL